VSAFVTEDYSERWFVMKRLRTDGSWIPREEAIALADAAFEGVPDDSIEEIFETTDVEVFNGTFEIKPATHYAWCGVIDDLSKRT
jgi:hypothetical protein